MSEHSPGSVLSVIAVECSGSMTPSNPWCPTHTKEIQESTSASDMRRRHLLDSSRESHRHSACRPSFQLILVCRYPFDTIRRRMMMTSASTGAATELKYKNTLDAFRKVIAAEGVASMFRGAGANILR